MSSSKICSSLGDVDQRAREVLVARASLPVKGHTAMQTNEEGIGTVSAREAVSGSLDAERQ